jgi:hypothetical protein
LKKTQRLFSQEYDNPKRGEDGERAAHEQETLDQDFVRAHSLA